MSATHGLRLEFDQGKAACVLYTCQFCADRFTRDDNLQRHLLSHTSPQYQCEQCGMHFHRTDVLKRHKQVHQPNPLARRRKPRRGPIPDSLIQRRAIPTTTRAEPGQYPTSSPVPSSLGRTDTSLASASEAPPAPDTNIASCSGALPLSVELHSKVLRTNEDAPGCETTLEAFNFCLSHFRHSCYYRHPFVHHTTISDPILSETMKLAIAAAAGVGFQKYAQQCRGFFERARQASQLFTSTSNLSTDDPSEVFSRPLPWLRDLQLRLLLLEYAMWSGESLLESWAVKHITSTSERIREFFMNDGIHIIGTASSTWESWTYDEELRRTIFAFHCLTSKTSLFLGHELQSPIEVEELKMPSSDVSFSATTESEWQQAAKEESSMSEVSNLQSALHRFANDGTDDKTAFGYLSRFGQHVLLCTLVFKVRHASQLPFLYETLDSYATADLSSLKVKTSFLKSFRLFRELLRSKSRCFRLEDNANTMDIQSLLLVTHLEISFLYCAEKENASDTISENHREALVLALEPFRHISEHGYYEVKKTQIATKAPWILDKSCSYATRTIAHVIIHWIDKLHGLSAAGSVKEVDKILYRQLARLVKDSPGFTTDIDTEYHQSTIGRIRPVVDKIMVLILA